MKKLVTVALMAMLALLTACSQPTDPDLHEVNGVKII
tara:strand:+ start:350 stop:460 length:111 start_codon:yes stop_codon:yes gene_type:complete